ncbi:MAG: 16S rRNA (cytosine(967)-C(5))-methyltransferase RsmB [Myxococcota bacterium]
MGAPRQGKRPRRGRPQRPGATGRGAPTLARLLALRVLERVQRAGAYADLALHAQLGRSDLPAGDRTFAPDPVHNKLRWRGRLDFLLSQLVDRDLEKLEPLVANALRLGAYQIVCSERVPPSAAVDQTVRCVRAAGADRASGLVNAVLRRLAVEHGEMPLPALESDPLGHLSHALSLPPWLAARWLELFGAEEAAALARASNEVPPLTVRANRLRTTADALLAELAPRWPEIRRCSHARDGLMLGHRGNPALDPAFLEGRFTVQDEASQLVVALLDPQPSEHVLDACAAPGGKAGAIAERLGGTGELLALDRHPRRLDLVRRHARRLGLSDVRCVARDATRSLSDLAPRGGFDRVLVDAPCSGLGTLRRNPDARWRVGPDDPARLAETQRTLLRNLSSLVRPGGALVYSTCTVLPEENEQVIEAFLAEFADFELLPAERLPDEARPLVGDDGFLRSLPHRHGADGFFAARLVRRP